MKDFLLRCLAVASIALALNGCMDTKSDTKSDEESNTGKIKETNIEISSFTWGVANIDPEYWDIELEQTAFAQFRIEIIIPETTQFLSRVEIYSPEKDNFLLFDASRDSKSSQMSSKKATFDCHCWFYNTNEPSSFLTGEYEIVVTDVFSKEVSKKFIITDIDGNEEARRVYTPEENIGKHHYLLMRPTDISFTVDEFGFVVSAKNIDSKAKSYQIELFDQNDNLYGKSDFRATTGSNLEIRLSVDELNFPYLKSTFDAHKVSITLFSEAPERLQAPQGHQAKSKKYFRDAYVEQEDAYNGSTYAQIESTHPSTILEGTSVVLEVKHIRPTDNPPAWYRWDLDGDGVFDTPFSRDNYISHTFWNKGWAIYKVEVVYDFGTKWIHGTSISVEPNPDTSITLLDLTSPWSSHEIKDEGIFLTLDPFFNTILEVDAQSGGILRSLKLDLEYNPEITYAQNGSYFFISNQGVITVYSRETFEKINEISYDGTITHSLITNSGIIIISAKEGYDDFLTAYHAKEGRLLSKNKIDFHLSYSLVSDEELLIARKYIPEYSTYSVDIENGIISLEENISISGNATGKIEVYDHHLEILENNNIIIYDIDAGLRIYTHDDPNPFNNHSYRLLKIDNKHNVIFIYNYWNKELLMYNRTTLEYIGKVSHRLDWIENLMIFEDSIGLIGHTRGSAVIQTIPHPCAECLSNHPPVAYLKILSAGSLSINDIAQLDASNSFDREDSTLQYRWDFDGDGIWDTVYSNNPTISYRVRAQGFFEPVVGIKDSKGAVDLASASILVTKNNQVSEIIIEHEVDRLPFKIVKHYYDTNRNLVYLAATNPGRLFVYDPASGRLVHQFTLGLQPTALAMSSDNDMLFVSMTDELVGNDDFDFRKQNFIGVIDLKNFSFDKFFEVNGKALELATSDEDVLFMMYSPYNISSGAIALYDIKTDSLLTEETNLYWRSNSKFRLAGSGNEQRVYVSRDMNIVRYEESVTEPTYYLTTKTYGWPFSWHYISDFIIVKENSYLIAETGEILFISSKINEDLTLAGRFSETQVQTFSYNEIDDEILYVDIDNNMKSTHFSNLSESTTLLSDIENVAFLLPINSEILIFQQLEEELVVVRVKK